MEFIVSPDKSQRGCIQDDEIYINLSCIQFPSHLNEDYFLTYLTSEIQKIEFHELGHFYYSGSLTICSHDYIPGNNDEFLKSLGYGRTHCPWCKLTQWYLGDQCHNIGAYVGNDEDEFLRRQKIRYDKLREL